jgi:hypothetical protein
MQKRLKISRLKASLCMTLIVLAFSTNVAFGQESFPPVLKVEGHAIYKKGTTGVPDPAGAKANQEALLPITSFMDYLAKVLDNEGSEAELAPAYTQLRNWAQSGALLQPSDTPGRVARVFITTGFGLLILKFKARGVALTPDVIKWYSALSGAVYSDYSEPLQRALMPDITAMFIHGSEQVRVSLLF